MAATSLFLAVKEKQDLFLNENLSFSLSFFNRRSVCDLKERLSSITIPKYLYEATVSIIEMIQEREVLLGPSFYLRTT